MSFITKQAILRTLIYADIFDYPLTIEELWKHLISPKAIDKKLFTEILKNSKFLKKKGDFYFLPGRDSLFKKRTNRQKESKRKMRIARQITRIIRKIPTIEMIGITGALAMNNSDRDDDIDLFVICSKKTLWITRFLVLLVLECLGLRRKRHQQKVSDTICVNMIITKDALYMPQIKKDLYTAHEIIQMRPVFEKKYTYQEFIKRNKWIKRYMFNSLDSKILRYKPALSARREIKKPLLNYCIVSLLKLFEFPARFVQLFIIKQHQTIEIVSDVVVAFHPFDYRTKILSEYKKRFKQYDPLSLKLRKIMSQS